MHSDRHRRRKSNATEIFMCNSRNHDLSRLRTKNEILFKELEQHLTSLNHEQRRRQNEMIQSKKALTRSLHSSRLSRRNREDEMKTTTHLKTMASHVCLLRNEVFDRGDRVKRWRAKVCTEITKPNTPISGFWSNIDGQGTFPAPDLFEIKEKIIVPDLPDGNEASETKDDDSSKQIWQKSLIFSQLSCKRSPRSTSLQETSRNTLPLLKTLRISNNNEENV